MALRSKKVMTSFRKQVHKIPAKHKCPPNKKGQESKTTRNAKEFRAALPRLFRSFHADDNSLAKIKLSHLRRWLRKDPALSQSLGQEFSTEHALRKVLRIVQMLPRVKQQQGFRYSDPYAKSGCAEALIGFVCKQKSSRKSLVFWDSYLAVFRLCVTSKDYIEIERSMEMKTIGVEKDMLERGNQCTTLANEMITITAHSRCEKAHDRRRRIKVVRQTLDLLKNAVIYRPLQPAGLPQWTLIYLHGMGSTAFRDYSKCPHYFIDGSVAVKVVIPQSPTRECSCWDQWWIKIKSRMPEKAPKWALQKMYSWYDYLTDRAGKREDDIDWQSLYMLQKELHEIIWHEVAQLGGRTDRVILGGKSQGCCTALDAAITFPKKLGGFVGIVGHILSCTPTDPEGPQASTPLHFFHEKEDTIMRWEWVQKGEQRLRDAGYRIHSRHVLDPERGGHHVGGIEGAWIRSALRSICSKR